MTFHTFQNSDLIPSAWLEHWPLDDFYVFNPAIVQFRDRLLMVYRVDRGREKTPQYRVVCAICQLDNRFRPVPGSVVPLSDTIIDGGVNHYDPRFLIFRNRIFVHYNNNWDSLPNQIFLVELDINTLEAKSRARRLNLIGERQEIEKNWMLFEHDGELYAIYQIEPHIILHLAFDDPGPINCTQVYRHEWRSDAYSAKYGMPRGGTPPVCIGEYYVSFFHSRKTPTFTTAPGKHRSAFFHQFRWWRQLKRSIRRRFAPLKYYGGIYAFRAEPPFIPVSIHPDPILHPDLESAPQYLTASHLTPRRVVYPCGMVPVNDGRWLVSYGVHDERCVLRLFEQLEIEKWINPIAHEPRI